jgi:hypothetical protein
MTVDTSALVPSSSPSPVPSIVDRILTADHARIGAPTLAEANLVFAGRRCILAVWTRTPGDVSDADAFAAGHVAGSRIAFWDPTITPSVLNIIRVSSTARSQIPPRSSSFRLSVYP